MTTSPPSSHHLIINCLHQNTFLLVISSATANLKTTLPISQHFIINVLHHIINVCTIPSTSHISSTSYISTTSYISSTTSSILRLLIIISPTKRPSLLEKHKNLPHTQEGAAQGGVTQEPPSQSRNCSNIITTSAVIKHKNLPIPP
jgi:hypothetical protein